MLRWRDSARRALAANESANEHTLERAICAGRSGVSSSLSVAHIVPPLGDTYTSSRGQITPATANTLCRTLIPPAPEQARQRAKSGCLARTRNSGISYGEDWIFPKFSPIFLSGMRWNHSFVPNEANKRGQKPGGTHLFVPIPHIPCGLNPFLGALWRGFAPYLRTFCQLYFSNGNFKNFRWGAALFIVRVWREILCNASVPSRTANPSSILQSSCATASLRFMGLCC